MKKSKPDNDFWDVPDANPKHSYGWAVMSICIEKNLANLLLKKWKKASAITPAILGSTFHPKCISKAYEKHVKAGKQLKWPKKWCKIKGEK